MTKPTVDGRIEEILDGVWAHGVYDQADADGSEVITDYMPMGESQAKQAIKQLISDVIDEIVLEKRETSIHTADHRDIQDKYAVGYNKAIDQIQANKERVLK